MTDSEANDPRKLVRTNGGVTRSHPPAGSSTPFRFLDLPGELRNAIYEQVLTERGDLYLTELFRVSPHGECISMRHPLLLTRKIVRSEGIDVLLKKNCLMLDYFSDSSWFLQPCARALHNSITRLSLWSELLHSPNNRTITLELIESCKNLTELTVDFPSWDIFGTSQKRPFSLDEIVQRINLEQFCGSLRVRSLVLCCRWMPALAAQEPHYTHLHNLGGMLKQWVEARVSGRVQVVKVDWI